MWIIWFMKQKLSKQQLLLLFSLLHNLAHVFVPSWPLLFSPWISWFGISVTKTHVGTKISSIPVLASKYKNKDSHLTWILFWTINIVVFPCLGEGGFSWGVFSWLITLGFWAFRFVSQIILHQYDYTLFFFLLCFNRNVIYLRKCICLH